MRIPVGNQTLNLSSIHPKGELIWKDYKLTEEWTFSYISELVTCNSGVPNISFVDSWI